MMKKLLIAFFIFTISSKAQIEFSVEDSSVVNCSHSSFSLGMYSTGISFGNSEKWNGLRINISDCDVKEVNGINITLWNPRNNRDLKIRGVALGLATAGKSINGISVGLAAAIGRKELRGINIGGIAIVGGNIEGINLSGIAQVSRNRILGLNVAGLALVSKSNIIGLNLSGLATVSNQNVEGLNIGGLAVVSRKNIRGLNVGGLAIVSKENVSGINIGGIGIVSEESIYGINLGGLGLVSKESISGFSQALIATISKNTVKGVNISGYKLETDNFCGINITAGWVELNYLNGLSISSFHKIDGIQKGIVIGILNITEELEGFQFGLINIAKNNKGLTQVLPFINCHF
ncbi:MAG: hypothetical protein N2249_03405 [Melioribacter sp.]|nr:hypothetical protein [Melioribacter sp.]